MAIVEAVAHHRQPQRASQREFGLAGVVHVAAALATGDEVDEAYLQRVRMGDRLDDWRDKAERIRESSND
jgi:hypothetical protein